MPTSTPARTPTATALPSDPASPWTPGSARIELFSPVRNTAYRSPIEVIGYSQTFEGNVEIRLRSGSGAILAERTAIGGSVDGFDFFRTGLRFNVSTEQSAILEVFETSANDGSEINVVRIPLRLLPGQRVIDLETPTTGAAVCSPVVISGYSNTFEASVVVSLNGRDGASLVQGSAMGGNLGVYRSFSTTLNHAASSAQAVLVSAYEESARGDGPIDQTRVPVTLYPRGTSRCP
jgi:hypothetical protein